MKREKPPFESPDFPTDPFMFDERLNATCQKIGDGLFSLSQSKKARLSNSLRGIANLTAGWL